MNGMRSWGASALMVLLATAGVANGTSVRLLNLPEMVRLADRVFLGRCLSAQEKPGESISSVVVESTRPIVGQALFGNNTLQFLSAIPPSIV